MTDQELLKLAAKAAGIEGKWGVERYIEQNEGFIPDGWLRAWNPLSNDGDALRLAVKLRLLESSWLGDMGEADPYAATRRAIVRAAAEIGRNMG